VKEKEVKKSAVTEQIINRTYQKFRLYKYFENQIMVVNHKKWNKSTKKFHDILFLIN